MPIFLGEDAWMVSHLINIRTDITSTCLIKVIMDIKQNMVWLLKILTDTKYKNWHHTKLSVLSTQLPVLGV